MNTLIPLTKQCEITDGAAHTIQPYITSNRQDWSVHIKAFCDTFKRAHGVSLADGVGGVEVIYDSSVSENAYRIATDGALKIYASTSEGLCYALATSIQLCDAVNGEINIPTVRIEDYPDKDYRAVMVDLGREWHPFNKLLKYVDLCYFYKIRYLNLHFADNKLYTLPSKAFPKLCVKDRYYTEAQIKELREYAKARGVVLVPEFECPGHAPVLNAYYPEIFSDCPEGEVDIFRNESGEIIDNKALICASSESAVEGVKTLLKEICELFPDSPYVHIGGDEANISIWEQCVHCREYMKKNGINGVYGLYSDYVARICSYVLSLGKTPMVWEGFPEDGSDKVPKETVVISWENHYQTTKQLLSHGFKIINASWKPLYLGPYSYAPKTKFSWGAREIFEWNVYNWQHWWEKSKATLTPINVPPTDQVIGAMLCAWEMTYEQEISELMVNLAAISERLWKTERMRSFDDFRNTLFRIQYLCARIIQDL